MKPYLQDPDVVIWNGDALDVLRELPDESVDCAATSPPFYGLRDYGVDGQIGLEASPDEWAARLVDVFREVRRVLKPQGTLWVECGDSYISGQGGRQTNAGLMPLSTRQNVQEPWNGQKGDTTKVLTSRDQGYKPKDLLGQPWLLAFALRADGWWLRQAIIWHKPNAMPESATDRCTTAHSYVFLLSKSARYWFDAEAISEPAEWAHWGRQTDPMNRESHGANGSWVVHRSREEMAEAFPTKNPRSVWTIPTEGYPEAHFATWPQALVERILKAGCPEQVCVKCGVPRTRLTETTRVPHPNGGHQGRGRGDAKGMTDMSDNPRMNNVRETTGWSDCGCGAGFTPGVVLDPFLGSGTTAHVARRLGRKCVGIELNSAYCELAAKRLAQQSLLAMEV